MGTCILGLDPERAARVFLEEWARGEGSGTRAGLPLPEKELLLVPGEDPRLQIVRALVAPGGPFDLRVLDPEKLLPGYAAKWNGLRLG